MTRQVNTYRLIDLATTNSSSWASAAALPLDPTHEKPWMISSQKSTLQYIIGSITRKNIAYVSTQTMTYANKHAKFNQRSSSLLCFREPLVA